MGKILIMDDEPEILELISSILELLKHEVVTAREGEEAITLFRHAHKINASFDVVIMDISVPGGVSGSEATKEILEIEPSAKVVAFSGFVDNSIRGYMKKRGFCGVLSKPFTLTKLRSELRRQGIG